MTSDRMRTLIYPLEQEILSFPAEARVLFLGAEPGIPQSGSFGTQNITCVQGFRPSFLALEREGRTVLPEPSGDDYDVALVLCGRHRGQNEAWVDEALKRTRQGGTIVIGGAKTDGVASLRKRLSQSLVIDGHASKLHGLAFWLRRVTDSDGYIDDISQENQSTVTEPNEAEPNTPMIFQTAPGMFSHEHVDPASRLLAECLPADLKGAAADFCAGWGYLSVALAQRAPAIRTVDLFEADHASLQAARRNLAALAPGVGARFFWQDLVGEPVADRYDVIVMNPPFHAGRAAEPSLGDALIAAASRAMKPRGRMFLVANRQLPYETALAKGFSRVEKLREEMGFKLFCAYR